MPTVITTPRPPLNLFESRRLVINDTWQTVYEVPEYLIPASGPTPARTVLAATIITGLVVYANTAGGVNLSLRVIGTNAVNYIILNGILIPDGDFIVVPLERQVLVSNETLQARVSSTQDATLHFSFVLNQREEFEVIT
jgi:hypothetical protein